MAGGWTRWGWLPSVLTPVRWSPLVASSNQNLGPIIWVWPVSSDHPQSAHRPCSDPADSTLHYTSCWQYTALYILLTVPYCTSCWLYHTVHPADCTLLYILLTAHYCTFWWCTLIYILLTVLYILLTVLYNLLTCVLYCTTRWLCTLQPADHVLYCTTCWLCKYFTVQPADCVRYCKTCWPCTLL